MDRKCHIAVIFIYLNLSDFSIEIFEFLFTKNLMLKCGKSRLHLLRISVANFFSLQGVFSGSRVGLSSPGPPPPVNHLSLSCII